MDDLKSTVTLVAPAKVNGIRKAAGATVTVSATLALQLAASGAISAELAEHLSEAFDTSETPLEDDFHQAVETAALDRIEELKIKNELEVANLLEKHGREIAEITAGYAAEQQKITDLLGEERAKASVLEGDLEAARRRYETAEEAAGEISGDLAKEKEARAVAEAKLAEIGATQKPAKATK